MEKIEHTFVGLNQSRLWFEWKKDITNTAYHNIFIFKLEGKVQVEALLYSINYLPKLYSELNTRD